MALFKKTASCAWLNHPHMLDNRCGPFFVQKLIRYERKLSCHGGCNCMTIPCLPLRKRCKCQKLLCVDTPGSMHLCVMRARVHTQRHSIHRCTHTCQTHCTGTHRNTEITGACTQIKKTLVKNQKNQTRQGLGLQNHW